MSRPHFVFDMDGVLIDSERVKSAAFDEAVFSVCGPDAARRQAVAAYNAANRGVPRDQKIAHVLRHILARPDSLAQQIAAEYARRLSRELPRCRPLPGIAAFLSIAEAWHHVASSAPVDEIRENLRRHGMLHHFSTISGHPVAKAQALLDLRTAHPAEEIVFFGDAPADLDAAGRAGVKFVAVNPNEELRRLVRRWAPDFTEVDLVLNLVNAGD